MRGKIGESFEAGMIEMIHVIFINDDEWNALETDLIENNPWP